jgi:glycosyltransferase involved in cell wall biosynthesis
MKTSLVIPSRNRPDMLRNCLRAIEKQTVFPDEILIIENDLKHQYKNVIADFPKLPIKLFLQSEKGKSQARNMGLEKAKYPIIAFLDDDCQPHKTWLEEIIKAFSFFQADVILGESIEKKQSLLMEAYSFQFKEFFLAQRIHFSTGEVRGGGALNTRNFALKKNFLKKCQLHFDTRYDKFGFAEDTDFGEQLQRFGAKIYYAKKAKVLHQDVEYLCPLLFKKFKNGRAIRLLKQKGIFTDFKLKKKKRHFVFERSKKLIEGKNVFEIVLLMFYLNIIVIFYKIGYYFESLMIWFKKIFFKSKKEA